jgi:hypothetical protein
VRLYLAPLSPPPNFSTARAQKLFRDVCRRMLRSSRKREIDAS